MPQVKPVNQSADKWARNAQNATQDYKQGVQNPRNSWSQGAINAKDAHAAGIQEALADGRYEKGIQEAGDAKWQKKAIEVGAGRFGQGVSVAKDDYAKGFAPYASVIEGVQLPPRGAKGDPRNYERSKAIGVALHDEKTK